MEVYISQANHLTKIAEGLLATRKHLSKPNIAEAHLREFLRNFVITQDEHDEANPFKPLPYDTMPHLNYCSTLWLYHQLLCFGKSRQLLMTWLWCACWLWDSMFKQGRLNLIINKREDDSDETIDRCRFIYEQLPNMLKQALPADRTPQGQLGAYCKLSFKCNNSIIRGLPQNPEAVRKNTASNLLIDEGAFIERAEECHVAAMPTVRGGGHIVYNSSAHGMNFFGKLFNDVGDDFGSS